jgi:hypothetical protein
MKPPVIWPFVPPVTGSNGIASAVNSNRYDPSGNFSSRPRSNSAAKRMRVSDGEQSPYDLTRDYPPLTAPPPLTFDIAGVRSLMVDASSKVKAVQEAMKDSSVSEANKSIGLLNLSLFSVLEALIEKVIIPSASNPNSGIALSVPPPAPPKPAAGSRELREAFAAADRTAILFDLDLGGESVGNRHSLSRSLAAGIRAAALTAAEADGKDMAEAVRRAGDALSCASDVVFLGQASRPYKNNRDENDPKNNTFHTMPVKLEFEDRQQRIYFEQSMRSCCKLRASISLPPFLQKERTAFDAAMRELYPGYMIMVRPDASRCVLTAVRKKDQSGTKWTPCPEIWTIPPRAVFADRDAPACGEFQRIPESTTVEPGSARDQGEESSAMES